ncbi:hypothetical protein ACH4NS_13575 [Streptomyces mutabilis]|uniref:hypothetical protein n=1 Tax=Streptomyces mutabilis TaxID=67332 RepID=UPI0037B0471A
MHPRREPAEVEADIRVDVLPQDGRRTCTDPGGRVVLHFRQCTSRPAQEGHRPRTDRRRLRLVTILLAQKAVRHHDHHDRRRPDRPGHPLPGSPNTSPGPRSAGACPALRPSWSATTRPAPCTSPPNADHLPQHATHEAVAAVIDGLTTASAGRLARDERGLRPCTPSGVIRLLDAEDFERQGARVVVVDWGELVGSSPLMHLLQCRGAMVTVAHEAHDGRPGFRVRSFRCPDRRRSRRRPSTAPGTG